MNNSDNPLKLLMPAVRDFARDQLDADFKPQDLSFALAYIATELGLHFTKNSTSVFPVVLRAMAHAVDARNTDDDDSLKADNAEVEEVVPIDAVLH